MATTTATFTFAEDITTANSSFTNAATLTQAGTTTGLDTILRGTKTLTATTNVDIFPTLIEGSMAFAGKSSWVYICNKSEDETEFATITISGNIIGKLYAGDYLWMPWSQSEDGHGNNRHGDIELLPSVATGMWFEWACINEGTEYPTAV